RLRIGVRVVAEQAGRRVVGTELLHAGRLTVQQCRQRVVLVGLAPGVVRVLVAALAIGGAAFVDEALGLDDVGGRVGAPAEVAARLFQRLARLVGTRCVGVGE